jgi:hypothetical protein
LYLAQFVGTKSKVARQLDGTKPKFGRQIVAVNMDVWRLVGLVTIEIEAIRAGSQHRRHPGILTKGSKQPHSHWSAFFHHKSSVTVVTDSLFARCDNRPPDWGSSEA